MIDPFLGGLALAALAEWKDEDRKQRPDLTAAVAAPPPPAAPPPLPKVVLAVADKALDKALDLAAAQDKDAAREVAELKLKVAALEKQLFEQASGAAAKEKETARLQSQLAAKDAQLLELESKVEELKTKEVGEDLFVAARLQEQIDEVRETAAAIWSDLLPLVKDLPAPLVASKLTEKEMGMMRSKVACDQEAACFFLQRAAHALKLSGVGERDPRLLEIMALLSSAEAQLRDPQQQQPLARGR